MAHEPIPFLDLVTPHLELEEELVEAFRRALRTASFVGGPEVEAFEAEFATYCGTKYCVGVGSGTDAVRFALMASGVGPGDAVVTVAHTFIATVEAISQAGAATEFVDIDPRTYCMSPSALETYLEQCQRDPQSGRPLGHRTGLPIKALLPVHLYGQMADMEPLMALAERYGLLVVEDACQAHGAEYRTSDGVWHRAGSMGTAAAFSFYPGKNLGGCGEGGAVTTNDAEVAALIRMLRDHGQSRKYFHSVEGYNGRLDAVQAAGLRIKLRHLDAWNSQRRAAAHRYDEGLFSMVGVAAPVAAARSRSVYHLYVILSPARDELAKHLGSQVISSGLHYPRPVHLQACYATWGYKLGDLPVTEETASSCLSLPMYPSLAADAADRVAGAVQDFVRHTTLQA